ncbi:TPA: hypothetical protein ACRRWY_003696 [Morganella morganii]
MKWLMFFIPHYTTEEVVFDENEGVIYPVCCLADVRPSEQFPWVGTMRSLSFMNFGYFPKLIGEIRPFGLAK